MNVRLLFTGLMLAASVSGAVAATSVYNISSTSVSDCGSASHGLWPHQTFEGICSNYFDISDVFTYEEGITATLTGSAVNAQGLVADIDLALSDFTETDSPKQENGAAYSSLEDTPDVDFFRNVSGQIRINDGSENVYDLSLFMFNFQFGAGAKDSDEFGAAAWVTPEQLSGTNAAGGNHWDLNLQLTRQVAEPGGLALLGAAALAFGAPRLRRRRQSL